MMPRSFLSATGGWVAGLIALSVAPDLPAQPGPRAGRQFKAGEQRTTTELPAGRFRERLERLPAAKQARALGWLRGFDFTEADVPHLQADADGGIYYADTFEIGLPDQPVETPTVQAATVPVNSLSAGLIFHSRPGAPNVLFINFCGETVTNTQWNTELGRAVIVALPFSTDSDYTTFSDSEQTIIKRVWQRMAEDYAPFDIDVTTERPATFTSRTAHALITRSTDTNGAANPSSAAGGVAYVNAFNLSSFASYRPAWVYHNNLGNTEAYIAEAASHEIGHNLGLSHDGTSTSGYYGGHGSGETSWGPLMGTGYDRNVTQWSKGEYYGANNTQDDLLTIASKITYRTDDHGNTAGTATALTITDRTNLVSTTPENDPDNLAPVNKGILERNTDVDVFSLVTGAGTIRLGVNPWIMPAGTRGGNTDLLLALFNDAGELIATNNPAAQTTALIQTDVVQGRYYLHVSSVGAGNPLIAGPAGYTSYGCVGQYFISGYVREATGYVVPPVASLTVSNLTQPGQTTVSFSVTFTDDAGINTATLGTGDLLVTGPNGFAQVAQLLALDSPANGTPRIATYGITPARGGNWMPVHNGTHTIRVQPNQVADIEGAWLSASELGQFQIAVPVLHYFANMDTDPGWTLEPQWQYGAPAYGGAGPAGGFTGTNIIGFNLSGDYANNLTAKYAISPPINCAGVNATTLRFRRWLRTRAGDTAAIHVSVNGTAWIQVWSTSSAVADTGWTDMQYTLPASVAGSSTVRLRWALASNQSQADIGWNIDDVQVLGTGSADTNPPAATLIVTAIAGDGSPTHSCSVTFTDASPVRRASLDSTDLLVTGPHGYSNLAQLVSSSLATDGSPITATYSFPAPGGSWDDDDNGAYLISLRSDAVEDLVGNPTPGGALGGFEVAIARLLPGVLAVSQGGNLSFSGNAGGPASPAFMTLRLTNSEGSSVTWVAAKSAGWIELSESNGILPPGRSVDLAVSANVTGMPVGDHSGLITFSNLTTGEGPIARLVHLTIKPAPQVTLAVIVGPAGSGTVSSTGGTFPAGTPVELAATPSAYFVFAGWSGDIVSTANPLAIALTANTALVANFTELRTTNRATPLRWLVEHGITNDFESAVNRLGANGVPMWQSYVAGLNPNDPTSQFRLNTAPATALGGLVLRWNTTSNRLYTVYTSTNAASGFAPLSGAIHLPWTTTSLTQDVSGNSLQRFFRIAVESPN